MTIGKKIPYSVDYALTVTLNPKLFRYDPPLQYRETHQALYQLLNTITDKFMMIPELTPQNQNVHYHGIIKIPLEGNKPSNYYIRNLFRQTKLYGHICIKQIDDYDKWVEYIFKDLPVTCQLLDLIYEPYKEQKLIELNCYNN